MKRHAPHAIAVFEEREKVMKQKTQCDRKYILLNREESDRFGVCVN